MRSVRMGRFVLAPRREGGFQVITKMHRAGQVCHWHASKRLTAAISYERCPTCFGEPVKVGRRMWRFTVSPEIESAVLRAVVRADSRPRTVTVVVIDYTLELVDA